MRLLSCSEFLFQVPLFLDIHPVYSIVLTELHGLKVRAFTLFQLHPVFTLLCC